MSAAEQKKSSFNALDVAVIVVLIFMLAAVAVRSGIADRLTFSGDTFTVYAVVENPICDFSGDLTDTDVFDANGNRLGHVKSAVFYTDSLNPDNTAVHLTLECTFMLKDGRYLSPAGLTVVKGTELSLHSQTVAFSCKIASVS